MKTIKNTRQAAIDLALAIMASGKTACFDLDGVLLDATHRQNVFTAQDVTNGLCSPDDIGALNIDKYRENSTAEKIAQDKTLAMIEAVHILNRNKVKYHVLTARIDCVNTSKLLFNSGILPALTMARQGENDYRRDDELKVSHLLKRFDIRERENMVLIDDNKRNLEAVKHIGLQAIHVPFEGH
jgi:FMN phosphatase YigB (HAD superfamily)